MIRDVTDRVDESVVSCEDYTIWVKNIEAVK